MSAPRRSWLVAGALVTATALTSCTAPDESPNPDASSPGSPSSTTSAAVEVVADGMDVPWSIAFYGETALISERYSARILELTEDGGTREARVVEGDGGTFACLARNHSTRPVVTSARV